MDELLKSYEEAPYPSAAFPEMHPDSLATTAYLWGMRPAPVDHCRFLEIGSGTGVNLLAMAASLPASRFVGVDLSPGQTDFARELAAQLGLDNVTLYAGDILEIGAGLGEFDYIGAHGVYSWCPPEVQQAMLALCARQLAPEGVAYISYNVLPGWHDRGPWRDVLRFGAGSDGDWRARVIQARRFLELVADAAPEPSWSARLKAGVKEASQTGDSYLLHEYLESYNEPLLFSEMAARAAAQGLQYLGESGQQPNLASLPPPALRWLQETRPGRIDLEQALDFFRNTPFRRSLFCRAPIRLSQPAPERVPRLLATAQCTSASPDPDVGTDKPETFRFEDGEIAIDRPLLKSVLVSLISAFPRALGFGELSAEVRRRLDAADDPNLSDDLIAGAALSCFAANLIELRMWVPRFASAAAHKPLASALARQQAARGLKVINLRHRNVELDAFEEALVQKLDGTRDRAALIVELGADLAAGRFTLERDGQPVQGAEVLGAVLEEALATLASLALLVA
jgi:SAM-dependent methyltransferase/methyltransferase-like protein